MRSFKSFLKGEGGHENQIIQKKVEKRNEKNFWDLGGRYFIICLPNKSKKINRQGFLLEARGSDFFFKKEEARGRLFGTGE